MPNSDRIVKPGRKPGTVVTDTGEVLTPPADWALLPPGDGPLTRNVKQRGPSWLVQVKKGRRNISKGIWAKEEFIRAAREEFAAKRATPEYARKRTTDLLRRERKHLEYVEEFYQETLRFLRFDPVHRELAEKLARAVTVHATPVGSGTVARTERIPLTDRVQAAVIAWMRHQTTAYDAMRIERVKGRRREVRRILAQRSSDLLHRYRQGEVAKVGLCPLQQALARIPVESQEG